MATSGADESMAIPMDSWRKITVLGDSLSRISMNPDNGCWSSHINHLLVSYFDVDIRGFDGYNTQWLQPFMSKLFTPKYLSQVELFIIFMGHNDSWQTELPFGVPVSQFELNLRKILEHLMQNGLSKEQIIMISPSWYHHEDFAKSQNQIDEPLLSKDFEHAKNYADSTKKVASDQGIDLLDFFDLSANYEPLSELFFDGCHLSRIGSKLLYDNLLPLIRAKIETKYAKPIKDLHHVIEYDQREDFEDALRKMVVSRPDLFAQRPKASDSVSASASALASASTLTSSTNSISQTNSSPSSGDDSNTQ